LRALHGTSYTILLLEMEQASSPRKTFWPSMPLKTNLKPLHRSPVNSSMDTG